MLTEYTQKVIGDFLNHYPKGSRSNYESAVNILFKAIEKNDVRKLNFEDYSSIDGSSSQDAYRTSFFRYIYAFDILENPEGFETLWGKATWINHFNNQLKAQTKHKKKPKYKPSLTLDQIEKIEAFLDVADADNAEILLLGFCWHMLFYTDCMVDEFRNKVDSKNFHDGQVVSGLENTYEIPKRFHPVLERFKSRNNHTGFAELGTYISKLGNYVSIKGLTPIKIKKARNENMLVCGSCGSSYANTLSNWVAVNGRIVCISCAELLKKNFNLNLVKIKNDTVEVLTEEENLELSSIIYTFDTIRDRLIKEKDYIKLHKFMVQIGKAGEAFVYDTERNNLKDTSYYDMVDNTKALDPSNGYDILSYDKNGNKIYIEVKTSVNEENDFIISSHELKTFKRFKREGKRYLIYKVSNILAKNKSDIKLEIIDDILNNTRYQLEVLNWKIIKK